MRKQLSPSFLLASTIAPLPRRRILRLAACTPIAIPPSSSSYATAHRADWTLLHASRSLRQSSPWRLDGSPARPSMIDGMLLHFTPSRPSSFGDADRKPVDQRLLKLGKTIRVLHERLPTLLHSPLPQDILSPSITLRLFPSTHPHLPSVSGRIAYAAALWTSPVAWGGLPVLGNVRLTVISERMVKNGGQGSERLIVKWKTCGKDEARVAAGHDPGPAVAAGQNAPNWQSLLPGTPKHAKSFTGLFLFEFDDVGRISSHTIEHAEEGGNWMRTTSAVISVTDWLLGRAWAGRDEPQLALGCYEAMSCRDRLDTGRPDVALT